MKDVNKELWLKHLHQELSHRINQLDFATLWPGFHPYKFAVYQDHHVCLDGTIIDHTDAFLANTAIRYEGDMIAIWRIANEDIDLDVLTSKIIHEMFHAFQMDHGESRFPNEIEALMRYQYDPLNLAQKMKEHQLMRALLKRHDMDMMNELLQSRKRRQMAFPYEYLYEANVEQIEGTAHYVELMVLKALSPSRYQNRIGETIKRITTPESLVPIRMISYDIGAILILLCRDYDISFDAGFASEPIAVMVIKDVNMTKAIQTDTKEMASIIVSSQQHTKAIIHDAIQHNDIVLEGCFELAGINIYDAKYDHPYATSTYFLAYVDEGIQKVLNGDFVVQLDEEMKIRKAYRIKK